MWFVGRHRYFIVRLTWLCPSHPCTRPERTCLSASLSPRRSHTTRSFTANSHRPLVAHHSVTGVHDAALHDLLASTNTQSSRPLLSTSHATAVQAPSSAAGARSTRRRRGRPAKRLSLSSSSSSSSSATAAAAAAVTAVVSNEESLERAALEHNAHIIQQEEQEQQQELLPQQQSEQQLQQNDADEGNVNAALVSVRTADADGHVTRASTRRCDAEMLLAQERVERRRARHTVADAEFDVGMTERLFPHTRRLEALHELHYGDTVVREVDAAIYLSMYRTHHAQRVADVNTLGESACGSSSGSSSSTGKCDKRVHVRSAADDALSDEAFGAFDAALSAPTGTASATRADTPARTDAAHGTRATETALQAGHTHVTDAESSDTQQNDEEMNDMINHAAAVVERGSLEHEHDHDEPCAVTSLQTPWFLRHWHRVCHSTRGGSGVFDGVVRARALGPDDCHKLLCFLMQLRGQALSDLAAPLRRRLASCGLTNGARDDEPSMQKESDTYTHTTWHRDRKTNSHSAISASADADVASPSCTLCMIDVMHYLASAPPPVVGFSVFLPGRPHVPRSPAFLFTLYLENVSVQNALGHLSALFAVPQKAWFTRSAVPKMSCSTLLCALAPNCLHREHLLLINTMRHPGFVIYISDICELDLTRDYRDYVHMNDCAESDKPDTYLDDTIGSKQHDKEVCEDVSRMKKGWGSGAQGNSLHDKDSRQLNMHCTGNETRADISTRAPSSSSSSSSSSRTQMQTQTQTHMSAEEEMRTRESDGFAALCGDMARWQPLYETETLLRRVRGSGDEELSGAIHRRLHTLTRCGAIHFCANREVSLARAAIDVLHHYDKSALINALHRRRAEPALRTFLKQPNALTAAAARRQSSDSAVRQTLRAFVQTKGNWSATLRRVPYVWRRRWMSALRGLVWNSMAAERIRVGAEWQRRGEGRMTCSVSCEKERGETNRHEAVARGDARGAASHERDLIHAASSAMHSLVHDDNNNNNNNNNEVGERCVNKDGANNKHTVCEGIASSGVMIGDVVVRPSLRAHMRHCVTVKAEHVMLVGTLAEAESSTLADVCLPFLRGGVYPAHLFANETTNHPVMTRRAMTTRLRRAHALQLLTGLSPEARAILDVRSDVAPLLFRRLTLSPLAMRAVVLKDKAPLRSTHFDAARLLSNDRWRVADETEAAVAARAHGGRTRRISSSSSNNNNNNSTAHGMSSNHTDNRNINSASDMHNNIAASTNTSRSNLLLCDGGKGMDCLRNTGNSSRAGWNSSTVPTNGDAHGMLPFTHTLPSDPFGNLLQHTGSADEAIVQQSSLVSPATVLERTCLGDRIRGGLLAEDFFALDSADTFTVSGATHRNVMHHHHHRHHLPSTSKQPHNSSNSNSNSNNEDIKTTSLLRPATPHTPPAHCGSVVYTLYLRAITLGGPATLVQTMLRECFLLHGVLSERASQLQHKVHRTRREYDRDTASLTAEPYCRICYSRDHVSRSDCAEYVWRCNVRRAEAQTRAAATTCTRSDDCETGEEVLESSPSTSALGNSTRASCETLNPAQSIPQSQQIDGAHKDTVAKETAASRGNAEDKLSLLVQGKTGMQTTLIQPAVLEDRHASVWPATLQLQLTVDPNTTPARRRWGLRLVADTLELRNLDELLRAYQKGSEVGRGVLVTDVQPQSVLTLHTSPTHNDSDNDGSNNNIEFHSESSDKADVCHSVSHNEAHRTWELSSSSSPASYRVTHVGDEAVRRVSVLRGILLDRCHTHAPATTVSITLQRYEHRQTTKRVEATSHTQTGVQRARTSKRPITAASFSTTANGISLSTSSASTSSPSLTLTDNAVHKAEEWNELLYTAQTTAPPTDSLSLYEATDKTTLVAHEDRAPWPASRRVTLVINRRVENAETQGRWGLAVRRGTCVIRGLERSAHFAVHAVTPRRSQAVRVLDFLCRNRRTSQSSSNHPCAVNNPSCNDFSSTHTNHTTKNGTTHNTATTNANNSSNSNKESNDSDGDALYLITAVNDTPVRHYHALCAALRELRHLRAESVVLTVQRFALARLAVTVRRGGEGEASVLAPVGLEVDGRLRLTRVTEMSPAERGIIAAAAPHCTLHDVRMPRRGAMMEKEEPSATDCVNDEGCAEKWLNRVAVHSLRPLLRALLQQKQRRPSHETANRRSGAHAIVWQSSAKPRWRYEEDEDEMADRVVALRQKTENSTNHNDDSNSDANSKGGVSDQSKDDNNSSSITLPLDACDTDAHEKQHDTWSESLARLQRHATAVLEGLSRQARVDGVQLLQTVEVLEFVSKCPREGGVAANAATVRLMRQLAEVREGSQWALVYAVRAQCALMQRSDVQSALAPGVAEETLIIQQRMM